MRLNQADVGTPTWHKIRMHYERRLDELHKQNDADLGETETAKLRGRIAEVKALLALGTADVAEIKFTGTDSLGKPNY